jgi:hypothetical protein
MIIEYNYRLTLFYQDSEGRTENGRFVIQIFNTMRCNNGTFVTYVFPVLRDSMYTQHYCQTERQTTQATTYCFEQESVIA